MSPTKQRRSMRRLIVARKRSQGWSAMRIAHLLGCSDATIYNLIREGRTFGPMCMTCGRAPEPFACPSHKRAVVCDLYYPMAAQRQGVDK